jgi:hypothetical protein
MPQEVPEPPCIHSRSCAGGHGWREHCQKLIRQPCLRKIAACIGRARSAAPFAVQLELRCGPLQPRTYSR